MNLPVEQARGQQIKTIFSMLESENVHKQLRAALPKHISPDYFIRVAKSAINENTDLYDCDPGSLISACIKAATDGCVPDKRLGVIVAYKNKRGGKSAQWQIMVGGVRQKVRNSGQITNWSAHCVYKNDPLFEHREGDDPHLHHIPGPGPNLNEDLIAAYSVVWMKDGTKPSIEVMYRWEIEKIRQETSRTSESGPWKEWYGEMCKKTVVKRHAKSLPQSTDLESLLYDDADDDDDTPPQPQARPAPPLRALNDRLDAIAEQNTIAPEDTLDEHAREPEAEAR